MAYTVIWFSKKVPEASRTAHLSHFMIGLVLAVFVVGLPLLAFYAGYTYMAPENMQNRLERQTMEVTSAVRDKQALEEKLDKLRAELNSLQVENLAEINKRAEAEARVSMIQTAKSQALEDVKKLKQENAELRAQLDVFQDILQPTSETLPIQCYNVTVREKQNGLNYSLSFLKTDNKDTRELTINLQARVLSGANVAALSETSIQAGDVEKQIRMTRLLTTTGEIEGDFPENGVRVLDIRGYKEGDDGTLVTHCWKSF